MAVDEIDEGLVAESQLFEALGAEKRQRLLQTGRRVTFEEGDVILCEGDEGKSFYLLEEGEVEISTKGEGDRVRLASLTSGTVFGEVPVFSKLPRTATVTATSSVKAIRFENEELEGLLEEDENLREALQTIVLDRARDTIEKIFAAGD